MLRLLHKPQQEAEGVSAAGHRLWAGPFMLREVIGEKRLEMGGNERRGGGHDVSPFSA